MQPEDGSVVWRNRFLWSRLGLESGALRELREPFRDDAAHGVHACGPPGVKTPTGQAIAVEGVGRNWLRSVFLCSKAVLRFRRSGKRQSEP
jgi:hypothetical protein